MRIELLGDNCKKCQLFKNNIEMVLKRTNKNMEFQFISEPKKFAEYGLLSLPGLAIDGEIKSTGSLLSFKEIKTIMKTKSQKQTPFK